MKLFKIILLSCCFSLIFACSSKEKKDELSNVTPDQLYSLGMENIHKQSYHESIKYFERISQEYPYSSLANGAQIMEAYANYRASNFEEAIVLLDDYINLYPGEKMVGYAYYLKAICYYDRILDVRLDQLITEQAKQALTEVINRFPNTDYARDAKRKLNLAMDHLAGKEMEIGRFYLKKGEIISAINRFKEVVEKYQTTNHIEEALYRLTECYYVLGINEEAIKYAAVLGNNYPNGKWYKYSYKLVSKGK